MSRIALGGIYHESNTFCLQSMTMERFARNFLHYGNEIYPRWQGTCSEMGGFLDACERFGFEALPTLMAWGMPLGPLTTETFETLVGELCARLEACRSLDGVLLSLHGAMVTEDHADADGEILARVRRSIGSSVPLVVTVDYHANLTEKMVGLADVIVGYDTYPHIDQRERGLEAGEILHRVLTHGLRPRMWLARRPLLPNILRQLTERPPMADAISLAHEFERRPEIVSVSVAAGFPYSDVPEAGFTVLAVSDGEVGPAKETAESIAQAMWQRRNEFQVVVPGVEDAVREAVSESAGLTILVDVGDNLGGGAPGDGTFLLAELLKQRAQKALVLLPDPEAVADCIAAGVRQSVRLKVGGKTDTLAWLTRGG